MRFISIMIDTEDVHAAEADLTQILRKYGPEPAPHLEKAFEAELVRVADTIGRCVQAVMVDTRK